MSTSAKRARDETKVNEFRACLSAVSLETGGSVTGILHNALDQRVVDGKVDSKAFGDGLVSVKQVRQKFTSADLVDIFADADEGEKTRVTIDELADYFQRTASKARALSLKLRSGVMGICKNSEAEYRKLFSTISGGSSSVSEREKFTQFAEDVLKLVINDNDAIGIYSLYDMDGDGKVSADDFVGFILGITSDAVNALDVGNGEVIVDIKMSSNPKEDSDLLRNGYIQVTPDETGLAAVGVPLSTHGSFGKGQNMWVWKRKQGTCSGRLRPVVDVQLNSKAQSSPLVLAGYTRVAIPVSGQYVWIKRSSSDEEDQDGLVDLHVSLGKTGKSIFGGSRGIGLSSFSSPGVGWVRVDGNFAKSINPLNTNEASLWMLPLRTRSLDKNMAVGVQSGVSVSEEKRLMGLLAAVRTCIRHFVPTEEMKRVAKINFEAESTGAGAVGGAAGSGSTAGSGPTTLADRNVMNKAFLRSDRMFDYSAIYHLYDSSGRGQLVKSQFRRLIYDAGACIDSNDAPCIFRYFDYNLNGQVSREEYAQVMSLTDYELAIVVEKMRHKLLSTCQPRAGNMGDSQQLANGSGRPRSGSTAPNVASSSSSGGGDSASVMQNKTMVRTNRVLSEVFRLVNANSDGIISLDELLDMAGKLELFVTEGEAQKIFKWMDTNGDGRVEEADFCTFMKRSSEVAAKTAQQVAAAANEVRAWVRQGAVVGASGGVAAASAPLSVAKPWAELKKRHEKSTYLAFPEYIGPDDLTLLVSSLSQRNQLSAPGARQLALLVAPDKCGRIQQQDLLAFASRPVRSFGELLALLERDIMKPVMDAHKACQASVHDGVPNQSLQDALSSIISDTISEVQGTTAVQSSMAAANDIVAVSQLKAGIEAAMSRINQFVALVPNVEEWASLACLVGAVVTEDDTYGVSPRTFIEGVCAYACSSSSGGSNSSSSSSSSCSSSSSSSSSSKGVSSAPSLETICKELQRLIRDEALSAGKWQTLDYRAAFGLFDTNNSGTVTVEEFRLMLVRLQLVDLIPENQLPQLLAMFDTKRSGSFSFDDFMRFVEKNKHLATEAGEGPLGSSLEAEGDPLDMASATKPPLAITRNADCDALAWALWKNCHAVEPNDPESVVLELEAACTEAELTVHSGTVSIKELWNLLFELKIQGGLVKSFYERGVRYLVSGVGASGSGERSSTADQTQVDFSTLCRYMVRMGRAHKHMLEERAASDEKKYHALKANLKRELVGMMEADEGGAAAGAGIATARRFDKVFKRLDSDGDGKLTPSEFKVGLKRLGVKDEKEWNVRLIKLLFADLDSDNDGYLSLSELSRLASDEASGSWRGRKGKDGKKQDAAGARVGNEASERDSTGARGRGDADFHGDDNDEENDENQDGEAGDDSVFGQSRRIVDDALLFSKAFELLRERVPVTGSQDHVDAIKAAVRKFFFRYDQDRRGTVSEERFRAFIRRSGLQDRLAAAEIRRLLKSLRTRKTSSSSSSSDTAGKVGGGGGAGGDIDYEMLCKKLASAALDGPRSRGEVVLRRLQDAAQSSAASGRPFLSLCALVDPKFRGRITREELILTAKMMTCPLSALEIDSMRELLPASAFGPDGTIDYKEINYLLTHATPRNSSLFDLGPRGFALGASGGEGLGGIGMGMGMGAASTLLRGDARSQLGGGGGLYATTPARMMERSMAGGRFGGVGGMSVEGMGAMGVGSSAAHSELMSVYDKMRRLGSGASAVGGGRLGGIGGGAGMAPGSALRRLLEPLDPSGSGLVNGRTLLLALEDMGISVSPAESMALVQAYGRSGDDALDYEAFCGAVDGAAVLGAGLGGGGAGGGGGRKVEAIYASPRVVLRLRELQQEGRHPRDIFEGYDLDRAGTVDKWRFQEVLQRLQLLSTRLQVEAATDDFAHISQPQLVCYEDFCDVLEAEARAAGPLGDRDRDRERDTRDRGRERERDIDRDRDSSWGVGRGRSSREYDRDRAADWDAEADPALQSSNVERWFSREASPKQRREFNELYDSLRTFKQGSRGGDRDLDRDRDRDRGFARGSVSLDPGSEGPGLHPPKVSDSWSFSRSLPRPPSSSAMRYSQRAGGGSRENLRDSWDRERDRDPHLYASGRSSPVPPRSPPSKVGSKMWGSNISLEEKGRPPRIEDGLWCCVVCLYTENSCKASKCAICDSANHQKRKDFVVKEQCRNCTFLNGGLSSECEMCGLALVSR